MPIDDLCALALMLPVAGLGLFHPRAGDNSVDAAPATGGVEPRGESQHGPEFLENGGQWPIDARFVARTSDMAVRASARALEIQAFARSGDASRGVLVELGFVDACEDALVDGEDPRPGLHHYYESLDPERWVRGMRSFSRVRYRELWPGIDLVLRPSEEAGFEYDLELAPGASLKTARFVVRGARSFSIDAEGALVIETELGPLYQPKPRATLVAAGGSAEAVECRFVRLSESQFGFESPDRDNGQALVVDPALLWGTYSGGTGGDNALAMDADPQGNVYITGFTESPDFPITPGAYHMVGPGTVRRMFVTKIAAGGESLVYSAVIGVSGNTRGTGIAADVQGRASVCGFSDGLFPTTPGAFDTNHASIFSPGVVLRLDATGSNLLYSTYLEGDGPCGNTTMSAIDVTPSGAVVVAGGSGCTNFPTTPGSFMPVPTLPALATLTRLDPTGSSLEWSTWFPAGAIAAVVVDDLGEVTFTGTSGTALPVTPGVFGPTLPAGTGQRFFATRLNAAGSALVWSTFVSLGTPTKLALDGDRGVIVVGLTESPDFLVTPGAFQTRPYNPNSASDGFVTRFSDDATELRYSTFLGGLFQEGIVGLFSSPSGVATMLVGGVGPGFPTTEGAFDTTHNGSTDAAITRLDPSGSKLYCSTFLGGPGIDFVCGLGRAPDGSVVAVGSTTGGFPVTDGAYDTTYNGGALDLYAAAVDLYLRGVRSFGASTPPSCQAFPIELDATRMPKAGDPRFGFYVSGAPRDADGWLLSGSPSSSAHPLQGAELWLDTTQPITRRRLRSDRSGFVELESALQQGTAGTRFACQAVFLNPAGCSAGGAFSASNALLVTVQQ